MGGSKPKPIKAPYEQKSTFAPVSISDTPEAQAFLDEPIDVDPGVGQRTDMARQQVENRFNSAFSRGIPAFVREQLMAKELRDVNTRGAQEARAAEVDKNRLKLARRQVLLPQIAQTGSSGFNTQITPGQPGLASSIIGGAAKIGAAAIPFI